MGFKFCVAQSLATENGKAEKAPQWCKTTMGLRQAV